MSNDTTRVYPLPRPPADQRFTFGLVSDISKVLVEHGYPRITEGRDLIELQLALIGFLYEQEADR